MIQLVWLASEPQYILPVSASTVCVTMSSFGCCLSCFVFGIVGAGDLTQVLVFARHILCQLRPLPRHLLSYSAGDKPRHGEVKS